MPCTFIRTKPKVSRLASTVRIQAGSVDIALTPHAALALRKELDVIVPAVAAVDTMRTETREALIEGTRVINLRDKI
jgi:hypothetical protein